MNKKITAIIAVRKGSKRVPNKNIRPFSNSSLLEIKLKQLKRVEGISEILVSSDCKQMIDLAHKLDVKTFQRPEYFSSDSVPMNLVYEHLASLASGDHILYVHVTSPLLTDKSLQDSIKIYNQLESKYDSLASVSTLHEYIWFEGGAINYDPHNHPRSQDLPDYHALNFAINILPKSVMIDRKNIVGKRFYPYFLDEIESIDVDTMTDFKIAEFLYENREIDEKI